MRTSVSLARSACTYATKSSPAPILLNLLRGRDLDIEGYGGLARAAHRNDDCTSVVVSCVVSCAVVEHEFLQVLAEQT